MSAYTKEQVKGINLKAKVAGIAATLLTTVIAASFSANVTAAERPGVAKGISNAAKVACKAPKPNALTKAACANVRIYDRVGWEAGRYISVKKHGKDADPGKYPGYKR
jgi:hypothetical protein